MENSLYIKKDTEKNSSQIVPYRFQQRNRDYRDNTPILNSLLANTNFDQISRWEVFVNSVRQTIKDPENILLVKLLEQHKERDQLLYERFLKVIESSQDLEISNKNRKSHTILRSHAFGSMLHTLVSYLKHYLPDQTAVILAHKIMGIVFALEMLHNTTRIRFISDELFRSIAKQFIGRISLKGLSDEQRKARQFPLIISIYTKQDKIDFNKLYISGKNEIADMVLSLLFSLGYIADIHWDRRKRAYHIEIGSQARLWTAMHERAALFVQYLVEQKRKDSSVFIDDIYKNYHYIKKKIEYYKNKYGSLKNVIQKLQSLNNYDEDDDIFTPDKIDENELKELNEARFYLHKPPKIKDEYHLENIDPRLITALRKSLPANGWKQRTCFIHNSLILSIFKIFKNKPLQVSRALIFLLYHTQNLPKADPVAKKFIEAATFIPIRSQFEISKPLLENNIITPITAYMTINTVDLITKGYDKSLLNIPKDPRIKVTRDGDLEVYYINIGNRYLIDKTLAVSRPLPKKERHLRDAPEVATYYRYGLTRLARFYSVFSLEETSQILLQNLSYSSTKSINRKVNLKVNTNNSLRKRRTSGAKNKNSLQKIKSKGLSPYALYTPAYIDRFINYTTSYYNAFQSTLLHSNNIIPNVKTVPLGDASMKEKNYKRTLNLILDTMIHLTRNYPKDPRKATMNQKIYTMIRLYNLISTYLPNDYYRYANDFRITRALTSTVKFVNENLILKPYQIPEPADCLLLSRRFNYTVRDLITTTIEKIQAKEKSAPTILLVPTPIPSVFVTVPTYYINPNLPAIEKQILIRTMNSVYSSIIKALELRKQKNTHSCTSQNNNLKRSLRIKTMADVANSLTKLRNVKQELPVAPIIDNTNNHLVRLIDDDHLEQMLNINNIKNQQAKSTNT